MAIRKWIFLLVFLPVTGVFAQQRFEEEAGAGPTEEIRRPARLQNKRFEKNLAAFAGELDLSPRQVRKLERLERKYARKERKLAGRTTTKKRHLKALQREKRERMINVLTYEQQHKLESLSRKGFWSFLRKPS